jgi:tRNA(fMet)-specific endonuclease VapC
VGLILDSSLLIGDERETLDLDVWLRTRPPEAVAVSAITFSELWFGIEMDDNSARSRRRQRWLTKVFRPLEIVAFDGRIARVHSRLWAQLTKSGQTIGPHDLIIAATALTRRWSVASFNVHEFQQVPGLKVIVPRS